MVTERQVALLMYINQQKQAYEWQWVIKNCLQGEVKAQFRIAHQANTKLIGLLESELIKDPSTEELYYDTSEKWSRALEKIIKAPTPEAKMELINLFMAWVDGEVRIEDQNEIV